MVYASEGAFDFIAVYQMPIFLKRFYYQMLADKKQAEEKKMKEHQAKMKKSSKR
tara:strand:- start:346 stop:507 length:162 start_codon:yes stop_codon:yes gene_type:complete